MLDFRWIGLLALTSCASAILVLKNDEIKHYTESNNSTLIAYIGLTGPNSNCSYKLDFAKQMERLDEKLTDENVNVAIHDGAYNYGKGLDHGSPIAVLYRRNREPYPITWTNDVDQIASWVTRQLHLPSIYRFTSKKEYDIIAGLHDIVFSAYLVSSMEIEIYERVSGEHNALFLLTSDPKLAKEVLKLDKEAIVVEQKGLHNTREEYNYGVFRFSYDKEKLSEWVREKIQRRVTEIRDFNDSGRVFSSDTPHLAILIAPQIVEKHLDLIKNFEISSKAMIESGKLSAFYLDSDKSENAELIKQLNSAQTPAIVLIKNHHTLAENEFTKRCTSHGGKLSDKTLFYTKENMFRFYENGLKNHLD